MITKNWRSPTVRIGDATLEGWEVRALYGAVRSEIRRARDRVEMLEKIGELLRGEPGEEQSKSTAGTAGNKE